VIVGIQLQQLGNQLPLARIINAGCRPGLEQAALA